jgi:hypothetical protein
MFKRKEYCYAHILGRTMLCEVMKNENEEKPKEKIETEPGTGGQNDAWPGEKIVVPTDPPPDTKVPVVR